MSEHVQNADNDDADDADDAFQTPKYWDAFYDDEEVYDWYSAAGAMYAACRRELRRFKRRGRVLDVGCGTASHLSALAQHADVTGVDFSETVISANKAREEGVTYLVEDASSLTSLADNSFDIVLDKGCLDCFVSAPDASFARRDAFLRSVTRVLDDGGVYLCMPVCGVDVVTLLTTGAAKRAKPDVAGAISDERDAWETQRSGSNGCAFEVLQIIASQQKHLFRCAPRGNDVAALCAQLEGLDADDDAEDFDDAPSTSLTLRRGFFCGSCGGEVSARQFGHAAGTIKGNCSAATSPPQLPQKKPRRSVSAVDGASSKSPASSSAARPSSCAQSAATSLPRGAQRKRCFCCEATICRISKAQPFEPDRCVSQASLSSDIAPATSGFARFAEPEVNKVTTSTPQTGMHR